MKRYAPLLIILLIFFLSNFSFAQNWKYDLDEALTLAQQKDQKVVLFFTGSDWCPPCLKLERKILSSEEFKTFADEKYVWLKADFPRRKKNRIAKEQQIKNEKLAARYNKKKVFPVILVLNKKGMVLGATGYRPDLDVNGYISLLTAFDSFGAN